MIMAIVPITMGTTIVIITIIEAMDTITVDTMVTGAVMDIIMAMVTIIIAAITTITTGTID